MVCKTPDGATYRTDTPPRGCVVERAPKVAAPSTAAEVAADEEESPSPESENPASRRLHAITICEQTVAAQLSNTGLVNWPSRTEYQVQEQGRDEFDVEGWVDTQSPLGDTRKSWRCRAVSGGDRWSAQVSLGEDRAQQGASAPQPRVRAAKPAAPPWHEQSPSYEKSGAVESPPSVAAAPAWGQIGNCPRVQFRDTYAERYANQGYQIVKGAIENVGSRPIRNVRVCASGTCTEVRGEFPPMAKGASEPFAIKVPSLETATVTAQCSLLAEPM